MVDRHRSRADGVNSAIEDTAAALEELVQTLQTLLRAKRVLECLQATANEAAGEAGPADVRAADEPADLELGPGELLTLREREVLTLLTGGLSNRMIARRLLISERTVKAHLHAVFRKLGVRSRAEAIVAALRVGIRPEAALSDSRRAGDAPGQRRPYDEP